MGLGKFASQSGGYMAGAQVPLTLRLLHSHYLLPTCAQEGGVPRPRRFLRGRRRDCFAAVIQWRRSRRCDVVIAKSHTSEPEERHCQGSGCRSRRPHLTPLPPPLVYATM